MLIFGERFQCYLVNLVQQWPQISWRRELRYRPYRLPGPLSNLILFVLGLQHLQVQKVEQLILNHLVAHLGLVDAEKLQEIFRNRLQVLILAHVD